MQIELIQTRSREGNISANVSQALHHIAHSAPATDMLVFSETFLTGFAENGHTRDRALRLDGPEIALLAAASRRHNVAIAIGLLENDEQGVFNTTAFITPEEGLAFRYRKTHLWPDERALVTAGDRLVCGMWRGKRIGLLICYDIEFPETARALAAMECDLLVVTNGNMDPFGPVHRHAALARACENQLFFVMTNRIGEGAGFTFAGESAAVDPYGNLLGELQRDEGRLTVTLDFTLLDKARAQYHYLKDRRLVLSGHIETCPDGQRWWPL